MKAFNFDLQRFALKFEYASGIKIFEDLGLIEDTAYYYVYQYYPTTTWNDYFEFQNYKTINLTAENYYRYYPETIREAVNVGCINWSAANWLSLHGWQYWQTVPGATVSGDYRILRGGNEEYHALSNYQADYVQMYGRNDGAVLKNDYGNYVLLFGGEGDDYIKNVYGNNATIDAGNGNDYIDSWGSSVSIDGAAGNDSIISYTNNNAVTIDGGANDDYIYSPGKNAKLIGGEGNDTIKSHEAANVTISGGAGNDSIYNYNGDNVSIDGGDGDDTITNWGGDGYVTIDGGAGNDEIGNIGSNVTIDGSAGNDLIDNHGSSVTIDGGDNNDVIWNQGSNVSISGGKGNDFIENNKDKGKMAENGGSVTIDGGDDNDEILNHVSNVSISGGKGNDFIENNMAENGGVDVTILGDDDKDTIKNNGSCVTIDGGTGDDSIINERVEYLYAGKTMYRGDEVSINGGDDNNTIGNGLYTGEIGKNFYTDAREFQVDKDYAGGDKVTIETGKGDDSIFNRGSEVTIKAGDGKNTVRNGTFLGGSEFISQILFRMFDSVDGGENVKIETGKDDDLIQSFNSSKVTIDTGDGNNLVSLSGNGSNISVKGGSNDDTIVAYTPKDFSATDSEIPNDNRFAGSYLTVETGGGNNLVSIASSWNYVTINGGAGDDKILNSGGTNVSINAGGGEKNLISVTSSSSEITIEGADAVGVDLIYNQSNGALIKGNSGFDDIKNSGVDVYMYGGADDDILTNYGDNAHIYGEGGEDYIYSDNATDIIIDGGENDDDIFAYHDIRALVLGGDGDDRIFMNRVSVSARNELLKQMGIDSFSALLSLLKSHPKMGNLQYIPTTIGDWRDWAGEIGSKIIDAVADEKLLIPRMGNAVKIAKGAQPWLQALSIVLTFWNYLDPNSLLQQLNNATSTVNGGKGNDVIVLDGFAPRVVSYSQGDGKDVIYHMATNQAIEERTGKLTAATHLSTLQIETGTIDDVTVDGKDVILNIGEGSVKLVNAAGFRFKLREADGTLTTRAYGKNENSGEVICSIFGSNADEVIKDKTKAKNIRYAIYGNSGRDEIFGNAKEDTLWGGNEDDTNSSTGSDTLHGEGGNDFLYATDNSLLDGGADDDTIYSGKTISYPNPQGYVPVHGHKNTVKGGTGNDEIYNYGNGTFIDSGANNDYIYNFGENLLLEGGTFIQGGYDVTIVGGTGDDYISNSGNNVLFKYTDGDGSDLIEGFNETSTLRIGDGTDTYSKAVSEDGFDIIVTVGKGTITLKDTAFLLKSINIEGVCKDKEKELPPGVEIEGDTLKFSELFTGDKFDVNDISPSIKNIDASKLERGIEIVGNSSVNEFIGSNKADVYYTEPLSTENSPDTTNNIASSNSFVVSNILSSNSITEENKIMTVRAGCGNDTIYGGEKKAKLYAYNKGDGNDVIYNFGATDTLNISGITYSTTKSGSDIIVTVGNSKIILKDAASLSSVNIAGEEEPKWTLTGTTATYGTSENTLFTLSGIKDTMGITVDTTKKLVTLTADNLNKKNVTVDGDYTLALSGVTAPTQTKVAGFDGTTYKTATIGEGYTASGNTITYSAPSGGKTLFTLSGVKNTTGVKVDTTKKIVTLTASNLNKKNVTVDGDYTLALSGVSAPTQTKAAGFDGLTYKTATIGEGYTVSGDTITYSAPSGGKSLFTLSGVKNTTGVKVDTTKKIVTLKATNLNKKNVTVDGNYKLKLASDVDTTKEDISKWTTLKGGNVAYLDGGKGSYYSASGNKVNYKASVAGANKIELSGVKGTPTLSGGTVKLTASNFKSNVSVVSNTGSYKVSLSGDFKGKTFSATTGKDSIVSSGKNVTIAGGKGNDKVTLGSGNTFFYAKGDGNDTLYNFSSTNKIKLSGTSKATPIISGSDVVFTTDGGKITVKNAAQGTAIKIVNSKDKVISNYTYTAAGIVDGKSITLKSDFSGTFDAKAYTKVDGSKVSKSIKILGSTGNDTLTGGAGNDTLTGGKGKDLFVFSGGKDTITDYNVSEDKISVDKNLGAGTYKVSGKNVVLTYGSNSLTIKNGLDKKIEVTNGTSGTYTKDGIFDSKKTSVTLPAATKTFKAASYSKLVTIDASAASSTINITGNKLANYMVAGNNGATLDGGKGNDTLWGGASNDSLYGGAGNDVFIYKAGEGTDKIFDYSAGDMLQILNAKGKAGSFTKSKYSGGTLSLTISGGGSVIFDGVAKGDTFNINDKSYKISGSKLK